jgi:hypothetical protein
MNPNIQAIIDATPKGEGGKWISILETEQMVARAVREAASVARAEVLVHSGLEQGFEGTVNVETRILTHFGL